MSVPYFVLKIHHRTNMSICNQDFLTFHPLRSRTSQTFAVGSALIIILLVKRRKEKEREEKKVGPFIFQFHSRGVKAVRRGGAHDCHLSRLRRSWMGMETSF